MINPRSKSCRERPLRPWQSLIALAFILAVATGCSVQDKGTPLANVPPTVTISSAPLDSAVANHYLTLRWAGDDQDGYIVGYRLSVDDIQITYTAASETTMAFASPVDSGRAFHAISVIAVDNEGLESVPAERSFFTVNYRPSAAFNEDFTPPVNRTTSAGFRITVSASDPNPSVLYYALKIDDGPWSPWVQDSIFLIGSTRIHRMDSDSSQVNIDDDSDGAVDEEAENDFDDDGDGRVDEDTEGLYPRGTYVISNAGLTSGQHIFYAKAKDAGDAESEVISRQLTINPAIRARVDSVVVARYGTSEFYPDGSIYYRPLANIETTIAFAAFFASVDSGEVVAYRYRKEDSAWSNWTQTNSVLYSGLPPGDHSFTIKARDLAGNETSNETTVQLSLVEQQLSRKLVVVDESLQRSPLNEDSVDAFYEYMTEGYDVTTLEFMERGAYVSPRDMADKGLMIWHAEDINEVRIARGERIMSEFLDRGGRLIISGLDWPESLQTVAPGGDTVRYFAEGSFGYDYLKLISARRPGYRQGSDGITTGFEGVAPYNISTRIDTARLPIPASWGDRLRGCWVFQQQGQCDVVGRMTVSDPSDPWQATFHGRTAVYVYKLGFRVAAFGVPLYFCEREPARELMDIIIEEMLEGLGDGP